MRPGEARRGEARGAGRCGMQGVGTSRGGGGGAVTSRRQEGQHGDAKKGGERQEPDAQPRSKQGGQDRQGEAGGTRAKTEARPDAGEEDRRGSEPGRRRSSNRRGRETRASARSRRSRHGLCIGAGSRRREGNPSFGVSGNGGHDISGGGAVGQP